MKKLFILGVAALALATITLTTGCAHFTKTASTTHSRTLRSAALPPGWSLVQVGDSLNLPSSEVSSFLEFNAVGTNAVAGWFAPRPVVFDSIVEVWTDKSQGGGTFLLTDPAASQVASTVNNQTALAGSHTFSVGAVNSTITTNDVGMVNAVGTAVGNVAAQIIKQTTPVGAASGAAATATSAVTK